MGYAYFTTKIQHFMHSSSNPHKKFCQFCKFCHFCLIKRWAGFCLKKWALAEDGEAEAWG
jgi:hypothetical protein